jgi:hypothetical protein
LKIESFNKEGFPLLHNHKLIARDFEIPAQMGFKAFLIDYVSQHRGNRKEAAEDECENGGCDSHS